MKLYTKKGFIKKIIILIIFMIIVNTLYPLYHVTADSDEDAGGDLYHPIMEFFATATDFFMKFIQRIMIGDSSIEDENGNFTIKYSPAIIFSNLVPLLDANFMNPSEETKEDKLYSDDLIDLGGTIVYDLDKDNDIVEDLLWFALFDCGVIDTSINVDTVKENLEWSYSYYIDSSLETYPDTVIYHYLLFKYDETFILCHSDAAVAIANVNGGWSATNYCSEGPWMDTAYNFWQWAESAGEIDLFYEADTWYSYNDAPDFSGYCEVMKEYEEPEMNVDTSIFVDAYEFWSRKQLG